MIIANKGKVDFCEKFDKLESTFKDGFKDMGAKFDRMADALMSHLAATGDRTGKFERSGQ